MYTNLKYRNIYVVYMDELRLLFLAGLFFSIISHGAVNICTYILFDECRLSVLNIKNISLLENDQVIATV